MPSDQSRDAEQPELPHRDVLRELDLDPASIIAVDRLRNRPTHAVFRLTCRDRSFILKTFVGPGPFREILAYDLLRSLHVPTLPVHGQTGSALLLEDLTDSPDWRLADEADNNVEATGVAVADWYRSLHGAGFRLLATNGEPPFPPWVDIVTADNLAAARIALGLQDEMALHSCLEHVDDLVTAYRRCRQTLNYEDFALENLALSVSESPRQAIVFDYDYFSVGTAFSDWRNVMFSLSGPAADGFSRAYGPTDPLEQALDGPLSVFQGLIIASQLARIPGWAKPLLVAVRDGSLERMTQVALQALG